MPVVSEVDSAQRTNKGSKAQAAQSTEETDDNLGFAAALA